MKHILYLITRYNSIHLWEGLQCQYTHESSNLILNTKNCSICFIFNISLLRTGCAHGSGVTSLQSFHCEHLPFPHLPFLIQTDPLHSTALVFLSCSSFGPNPNLLMGRILNHKQLRTSSGNETWISNTTRGEKKVSFVKWGHVTVQVRQHGCQGWKHHPLLTVTKPSLSQVMCTENNQTHAYTAAFYVLLVYHLGESPTHLHVAQSPLSMESQPGSSQQQHRHRKLHSHNLALQLLVLLCRQLTARLIPTTTGLNISFYVSEMLSGDDENYSQWE